MMTLQQTLAPNAVKGVCAGGAWGPVSMKLDQAATSDGPQETGSATGLRWADWVGANGTLANGI